MVRNGIQRRKKEMAPSEAKTFSKEISEFFKEQNVQLVKFPSENTGEYSNLDRLQLLVQKEVEFWANVTENLQSSDTRSFPILQVRNHFRNINDILKQLQNYTNLNEQAKNKIKDIINKLSIEEFPAIYSVSEEAELLKYVGENYGYYALNGCLKGLFEAPNNLLSIQNTDIIRKEFLLGLFFAYKFKYPDIESDYFALHKNSVDKLFKDLNSNYKDFLADVEKEKSELFSQFTNTKQEIEDERQQHSIKLDKIIEKREEKFDQLENKYSEHLKLKKPAEYWEKAAEKYEDKGKMWKNWALGFGSFYLLLLACIILIAHVNNDFNFSSIKFAIVLTVLISVGFLLLNLFIKLSISNFHLANDARERHHLTYFYLALLDETDIEGEEKTIILQSLFSRAESGLIRSDSGPQIPGNQAINALIKERRSN